MKAEKINRFQHPIVRHSVQLRTNRSVREQEASVLICGRKLIVDVATHWPIKHLFCEEGSVSLVKAEQIWQTSPEILQKITGLEEPDGWAAIVPHPRSQSLSEKRRILVLDQINDPGNVGTLWRTALALGWQGVWMTPGSADPCNDKALRAAQGATFVLPYEWIRPEEILKWSQDKRGQIYTAHVQGTSIERVLVQDPCVLVLSNEGRGPSEWALSHASLVTIPMKGSVESLNVASAGAILLHAMRPMMEG